jgi:uncharacterized membrane protein YkoI
MNHAIIAGATLVAALSMSPAYAQHDGHHDASLETCLHAAAKIRRGEFAKVEYLSFSDEGVSVYEIEVQTPNGQTWEFECDAHHGQIIEIEREVDGPSNPAFAKAMKVSEDEARATALALYPGTIDEVEYEIELNGDATYELDIVDTQGVEWKVEINAGTGEIDEVQIESWEIGLEDKS